MYNGQCVQVAQVGCTCATCELAPLSVFNINCRTSDPLPITLRLVLAVTLEGLFWLQPDGLFLLSPEGICSDYDMTGSVLAVT